MGVDRPDRTYILPPFDQAKHFRGRHFLFGHRWMETSMTRAWSALEGAESVLTPGSGSLRLKWLVQVFFCCFFSPRKKYDCLKMKKVP